MHNDYIGGKYCMDRKLNRKIILENGTEYYGIGFGDNCDRVCELVFCTAMAGYQEVLSNPSCMNKMVVMTYPLIGNYGIADDDFESRILSVGGFIVREYNDSPSNFRYTKTLSEIMEENHIPGISGIDTRMLTRSIRDNGSCKVLICDIDTPLEKGLEIIKNTQFAEDMVAKVSCSKRWYSRTANPKFNVVAVDCGIKLNIIRCLNKLRCNVTVVPWNTDFETIDSMKPDGVLISNGPGNPEDIIEVTDLIKKLRGKYPIFGIALGHELICMAYGAKIYKMKLGHSGGNHPVKNILNNKLEITSQNHANAVDPQSLNGTDLEITHINVLDNSVEGVRCLKDRCFSVQYNPESAPGPQDSLYLFDTFIDMMQEEKNNA